MNIVYWSVDIHGTKVPRMMEFPVSALNDALKFSEKLRKHKRDNESYLGERIVGYITMSCEHPDSVGQPGVDVTGSDYDWSKKHRGAGPVAK